MIRRLAIPFAVAAVVAAGAFAVLVSTSSGGGSGVASDWSDPGRRVYGAQGCGSCHRLDAAGSTGRMGPSLDTALAAHDRDSLRAAIVDRPTAGGFSAMPDDYGERMTPAELDALVAFLLAAR